MSSRWASDLFKGRIGEVVIEGAESFASVLETSLRRMQVEAQPHPPEWLRFHSPLSKLVNEGLPKILLTAWGQPIWLRHP